MSKHTLVSVITVVFNNVDFIEDTIKSVVNQNYNYIEYIIIDGGSIDGTFDVINKYNHNISTFISESDDGMYDALNKGLSYCKGDLIVSLNSDDCFVDYDVISKVVHFYENNKCKDGVYFGYPLILENEATRKRNLFDIKWQDLVYFGVCTLIPQPCTFVSKNTLSLVNNFNCDYKVASDYDFIIRAVKASGSYYMNTPISFFKKHDNSITEKQASIMQSESDKIVSVYSNELSSSRILYYFNRYRVIFKYLWFNKGSFLRQFKKFFLHLKNFLNS